MSAPDATEVEAAVRAEDADRVRVLLAEATEADRRALAQTLKPLLDGPTWERPKPIMMGGIQDGMSFALSHLTAQARGEEPEPSAAEQERRGWWELRHTSAFAALALGVAGSQRKAAEALDEHRGHGWHVSAAEWAALAGVLADRNPPWLAVLAESRLGGNAGLRGCAGWPLVHGLVRLGAIGRPAVPEYGAAMVAALAQEPPADPPLKPGQGRCGGPGRALTGTGGDLLAAVLRADPGLLEHEVWRLFTDPGVGKEMADRSWATSWEQWVVGDQWQDALVALAADGDLDRDRLLDESLGAFHRDFPPNHVAWYAALHDRLAPSDEEAAARSGRYLALLAAPSKAGVSLGQQMCARLLDPAFPAGRLDPEAFLAASGPALLFPQKAVATAQLKLVGQLVVGPSAASALVTAAQGFAHQREDVQAAALKLVTRHGLPQEASARAEIIERAAALSPVLWPDAQALGLVPAEPSVDEPALVPEEAPALSVISAPAKTAAVTQSADLVRMLSQLLEDASDTLAVERALAGAVRLAALPLSERAASARPLLKRARKQALDDFHGPFSGHAIRADLGWLALTWGTGELPPPSTGEHQGWDPEGRNTPWPKRRPQILSGLLSARIGEACTLIAAGRVGQLRAEPQFADGTISPAELDDRRARWAAARLPPCRYDLEIARLRAAPGSGEVLELEPVVTTSQVKYRRTPWGEKLPYTDDRPAVLARLATAPKSAAAPYSWRRLTDLEHSRDDRQYAVRHTGVRLDEMVAAWSLLCPHDPELAAAHLLSALSDGLGPGRNAAVTALRGLVGLPGTFGPVGHLALVTGLSGAAAEGRIAAADAWGQLDRAGRLDPVLAAAAVKLGVNGGALKLIRIADGLGYAAADPAAAVTVTQTCLAATAALLPGRPAGLHLLLELAARSAAGSLAVPPAVAALAAEKGGGKLAGAARRLTRLG